MEQLKIYQQQDDDIFVNVEHLEQFQQEAQRLYALGTTHMLAEDYKRAHAAYAGAKLVANLLEETVM
jgi:hypothetical protein